MLYKLWTHHSSTRLGIGTQHFIQGEKDWLQLYVEQSNTYWAQLFFDDIIPQLQSHDPIVDVKSSRLILEALCASSFPVL